MPRAKAKAKGTPKSGARRLKCDKCDRTFAMPAHLARHQNTIHGKRTKSASTKRTSIGRAVKKIAARPAASADMQLVGQMRAYRNDLATQRAGLDQRIDAIDRAMSTLGATGGATTTKRKAVKRGGGGRKQVPLKMCVEKVLRRAGKPMSVKDVTSGVIKVGYKTSNKTLDKSVGIALAAMSNVVRISRGVFRLK